LAKWGKKSAFCKSDMVGGAGRREKNRNQRCNHILHFGSSSTGEGKRKKGAQKNRPIQRNRKGWPADRIAFRSSREDWKRYLKGGSKKGCSPGNGKEKR